MKPAEIRPGDRAPEIALPDLEGRPARPLAPAPGSRGPAVLVFVKEDCPTCRFLLPFLGRLHAPLAASGARLWIVSQDGPERSRAVAEETGVRFPVILDGDGWPTARAYGVTAVPTTFLVGEDGIVRRHVTGFVREEIEALARDLSAALGEPVPELFRAGEEVPDLRPG